MAEKSSSKGLKRKAKGKSEDKLKVKPKKFKKEIKAETFSGGKRKANGEEDGGNKVVKEKKRKSEEQQEGGKKTFSQLGKGKKKIGGKFDKGNKKWNGKGKFNSSKTKKQHSAAGSAEKPNIWQMKKKERKQFRRQQDENYALLHDLNKIYETLRRKNCSKANKSELINKTLDLIAGHSHDVIFKHDAGRVLQSCVKFGTAEQRQRLFEQFKGDFVALIKSKYSKFFVKKMLKYGTKEQRDLITKSFYGEVRRFVRHKEASSVLETIYTDYADSEQKAFLVQEFYAADFAFFKSAEFSSLDKVLESQPERKAGILKHMKEMLLPLLEKSVIGHSIVHKVLLEYFTYADDNSKREMVDIVKDSAVLILHTHDGARVAMQCFWLGTAKDRKSLIKSFKTYYAKICKEEFGHLVLLALLDSVDDTVLVKKIVFSEIQSNLKELALDTYGRKVLIYLLCPRSPAYFHPTIVELLKKGDENTTSKKDTEQRQRELLEGISPALLQLVEENLKELIFDKGGCQLLLAALLKCAGDLTPVMVAIAKLADKDLDPESAEEDHVIKSAAGHFAIKRLIIQDKERAMAESKVLFSNVLLEYIDPGKIFEWCKVNRGAFVVASLLESSVPGVSKTVRNRLLPRVAKLKKYDSKGVAVVLKLLSS
ncbi:pumilio homolog 3-like [Acropora muricata]|uniref:pumilio homolog 3-like n=1 Tax=Acropora muricata TaxID=159855 RepID=UPI0034E5C2D5